MKNEIKVGDKVTCSRGKQWKVFKIESVFGIPAADLIPLRKDGSEGVIRGRRLKNLPTSVLEKI